MTELRNSKSPKCVMLVTQFVLRYQGHVIVHRVAPSHFSESFGLGGRAPDLKSLAENSQPYGGACLHVLFFYSR